MVFYKYLGEERFVTSCERRDDKSRVENGNSTVIHTKSYYSGSSEYSFDIEIETVCEMSFCFGQKLRCDKCVVYHTTTLYSNTDTSKIFSDSTVYIEPAETTAQSSINITATSPISTTVNQSSLATGSDEIIVITSSVVGFVLLVGILLGIAYKYKSKGKLSNQHTVQTTEQLPPSIFHHSQEAYGKECLENRTQSNVSNNKTDQAKLTQEIGNLSLLKENHKKSEKKKTSSENEESKQGDNQTFNRDHGKNKRKKLKVDNSSEHSSSQIDMNKKQMSPHINARSAIENTRSVSKETQETLPVHETEQQNNKGHSDNNYVKDRSTKQANQLHKTDINLRNNFGLEPKSTTGITDEPYKSDGRIGPLLPPEEIERSYKNKSVKRPYSAMPPQNMDIPDEMLLDNYTKSKSTLDTTDINVRPAGLTVQFNNLMTKSDVMAESDVMPKNP